jgi:hypothetical protein
LPGWPATFGWARRWWRRRRPPPRPSQSPPFYKIFICFFESKNLNFGEKYQFFNVKNYFWISKRSIYLYFSSILEKPIQAHPFYANLFLQYFCLSFLTEKTWILVQMISFRILVSKNCLGISKRSI